MSAPLEIDCFAVRSLLDEGAGAGAGADALLLDCREVEEYETARIEGCLLIPMSELGERVGELDAYRERAVVVYCHHGVRSRQVAAWLRRQGFAAAVSMAGGIEEWAQRIDPGVPRY